MIHFFTDPYKDELIYSAIARYHYYIGNADLRDTLQETFGNRNVIPNLDIANRLDDLCCNLGEMYTPENIINKHTTFPFYSPFLLKNKKEEIINDIKYSQGSKVYARLGMIAGSICNKNKLYYCPCCAKEDIERYGESYIHREHQLQGVYICPHHGCRLKPYIFDKTNSSRIEFIRFDKELLDLRNIQLINSLYDDRLYKLSQYAYYLLQADLDDVHKKIVVNKYKNLLYERDLATSNKRIKQRELYEEFLNFYGEDFLKIMQSNIDNNYEFNWLRTITRNVKRAVHPIRHLLFINFLVGDIEKFFNEIKNQYKPFGKGPWPCLNSAANHYKMNVVNELKVTQDYKTRKPVGTFTCSCGFVYSRKGPDKLESDKFKIGTIKKFGAVWEEKLKGYLKNEKYGLRELGRIMKCDAKTILKYDRLLKVNYFNDKSVEINNYKYKWENKEKLYKEVILKTIKDNSSLTRTEIRLKCKKEYIYLYRNQKVWLYNNLPNKVKKNIINKRVDWRKRDNEIVNLLKNKYRELISEEKPVRITKSRLGKAIGKLAILEKNLDKLPKSNKYLSHILESVEEFQIRRCKKIIDDNFNNEECIRLWELQRLAGIRNNDFKKIKNSIENYIKFKTKRDGYEQKGG